MSIESKIANVFLGSSKDFTVEELIERIPNYTGNSVQTATSRLVKARILERLPKDPLAYRIRDRAALVLVLKGHGSWRERIASIPREYTYEDTRKYDFTLLAHCFGHYTYPK